MARPILGRKREKIVKIKRKNGDTYVYRRRVLYNPEKGYDDVLSSTLIGKYRKGSDQLITETPRRRAGHKAPPAKEENTAGAGIGLSAILEFLGRESGIDADLKAALSPVGEEAADQLISLARFQAGTGSSSLSGLRQWQMLHQLPCRSLTPADCRALFATLGQTPGLSYRCSLARAGRLSSPECLAAVFSTGSTADGLSPVRYLSLYAAASRQPLAFCRLSGTLRTETAIKNAVDSLNYLNLPEPTLILDSSCDPAELILQQLRFIARVEVRSCHWLKELVTANLQRLQSRGAAVCPFDAAVSGFTLPVQQQLAAGSGGSADQQAGEKISFTSRLYVHVFLDHDAAGRQRAALNNQLRELEQAVRAGHFSRLSWSARRLAVRFFKLSRSRQGLKVTARDDYYQEMLQLCGIFVLISNNAEFDTFAALSACRMAAAHAAFLAGDSIMPDLPDDGRFFCQQAALGYREQFCRKLHAIRAGLEEIDSNLPGCEQKVRRDLRAWLDNLPAQEILDWFDCLELQKTADQAACLPATISITPETRARDALFLKLLGMNGGT